MCLCVCLCVCVCVFVCVCVCVCVHMHYCMHMEYIESILCPNCVLIYSRPSLIRPSNIRAPLSTGQSVRN